MRRDEKTSIPGMASRLFVKGPRRSRSRSATVFAPRVAFLEDRTLLTESTGLTLIPTPTTASFGQAVSLDAKVQNTSFSDNIFVNGTVNFYNGATNAGTPLG